MFNFCEFSSFAYSTQRYVFLVIHFPAYETARLFNVKKKESDLIALSTSCSWYERVRNSTFSKQKANDACYDKHIFIDNENSDRIILACLISRKLRRAIMEKKRKETGAKKWNFTWREKWREIGAFKNCSVWTNRYRSTVLNIHMIELC